MSEDRPTSFPSKRRVVPFRRGPARPPSSPAPDLGKYERGDGDDEYRHRMMVNAVAFVFVPG